MGDKGSDLTAALVANRTKFLAFLRTRVESDEAAEELLQAAYAKGLARGASVKDQEKLVAWFYRLLRNLLADHYRRKAAGAKALERFASDPTLSPDREDPELERAVCRCVHGVIAGLKPEYSELLKKVELEDSDLKSAASKLGLTANNAAVRLHRARKSLKKGLLETCGACAEHACLDCDCRKV